MDVNQKQLAQCLGISTRRIRQLREDGVFKRKDGKASGYHLESCIQEYINYKVNAEMGRSACISKEEVQAQHEEVKKQISILKLRKLRRELHEAADVENFLSDMLVNFRNRLLEVPTRIAMKAIGESDLSKLTDMIKSELLETLKELSHYDPEEIDGIDPQEFEDDEEEIENEEDDIE